MIETEEEYEKIQAQIRKLVNKPFRLNQEDVNALYGLTERCIIYEEMNFEFESMRTPYWQPR